MPPSGPSALWSSNNSVQLNTNSQDAASGGGGIAMNNHVEDHDVIGSLGKVLSDVKLDADGSGHGSNSSSGGGQGQQGYGAPGAGVGSANQGSWSGLSGSTPQAAGISYNFYGNGGNNSNDSQRPAPAKGGEHDSLQNILYDSGIYEKEEVTTHRRSSTGGDGGARPSTPSRGERKPSIDMFLSQSPSKTLGEDAFRHVMHRTSSNPSLVGSVVGLNQPGEANGNSNNVGLGGKPLASTAPSSRTNTAPSSRTESPQTVRVNSTGSSPYNANGKQMYNPSQFNNASTNNGAANNFSSGGVNQQQQGQLLQPSLSNQFSSSSNNSGQQQQHQAQQQQQQQQQQPQQYVPMPVSQQQPQVFYMAVPGPDGKQVLQPVQMVQMPGQNGTIMMPVAANGTQGSDGNQGMNQGQHMMLMQPQANNGMGGNMYGQDNGGSNNQYSQYGDSGGYDNMDRGYQSKNNGMNQFGGGGQYQQPDQGGDPSQIPMGSVNGLYSSPQRPPLRALLGNVRRLSRDQVGCRLLQQALDEDGPSAATAILNEGLTFWAEAMVDPFGNYLFQKILERITPEERVTLVSSVSTRLVNASLNLHGTRSVQKIVEVCAIDEEDIEEESQDESSKEEEENKKEDEDDDGDAKTSKTKKSKKKKDTAAKILTDALKPSAARLCIDSHGNHAIQRILLKLPYQYTQFIFDAVAASVEDVARHRHGCCVIQRCLDSRHSAARTHLVSRIVEKSLELMQDAYGNYVVQYVLDVCGDDEVHAICESVIGRVCLLAIQKFSSNVMEKCLERCTDRVREEYLNELNDSERIRELMMDPFGNYVVQRALSVSTHAQAIRLVETMKPHLSNQGGGGIRNTAGGRRILGKICRRFPNFVLEGETFEDYDLNSLLARGASPHHSHSGPVGGGRRGQNQFGGQYPQGPSPNHRRSGRGGRNNYQQHHHHQQHIPQYQQQQQPVGHHIVQQSDMNLIPNAYGGNPYMFP